MANSRSVGAEAGSQADQWSRRRMKQVQTSIDDLRLNRWLRSVGRFCYFVLPINAVYSHPGVQGGS